MTYPELARTGQDSIFHLGQVNDGWNKHITAKTIDWGDGNVVNANGGARWSGFSGNYQINFVVRGDVGVSDGPILVGGSIVTVSVHSFDALANPIYDGPGISTGSDELAIISIPGQDASPGDFTAKIHWGDGSETENGTISSTQLDTDPLTGVAGPRTVVIVGGTHVYVATGTYSFTITITNAAGETRTVTEIALIDEYLPYVRSAVPPTAPAGHYATSYRFGHPDSAKKIWVPETIKASHPGHRKPPHHHRVHPHSVSRKPRS